MPSIYLIMKKMNKRITIVASALLDTMTKNIWTKSPEN